MGDEESKESHYSCSGAWYTFSACNESNAKGNASDRG